jgi:hypothetical protein
VWAFIGRSCSHAGDPKVEFRQSHSPLR